MQALAKRVNARGGAAPSTEGSSALAVSTGSTLVTERRGPRNQPKRKGRK